MRTRQRIGSLTTVVLLGAVLVGTAGQRQPPTFTPEQEARLQIREVKDGLYVIPGFDGNMSGGNVAVRVTDDGVIIVDDKYLYSYDFIAAQVRSVTDQPIRYVLNTHHHFAHAGSNADFMQNAGPVVGEIDLNPIMVLPEGQGCVIVDALIATAQIGEEKQ